MGFNWVCDDPTHVPCPVCDHVFPRKTRGEGKAKKGLVITADTLKALKVLNAFTETAGGSKAALAVLERIDDLVTAFGSVAAAKEAIESLAEEE